MLNDQQLATIANELQLPMVFDDIINGRTEMCEDLNYAMHELISNMQPDTALLAMALASLKISERYGDELSSLHVLSLEARQIVDEYGATWLENMDAEPGSLADDTAIQDLLAHVPEDLESLAELAASNAQFLGMREKGAADLLNIIAIQAGSQALIAEEFLEVLNIEQASTQDVVAAANTNNVIQFPMHLVAG